MKFLHGRILEKFHFDFRSESDNSQKNKTM